MRNWIHGYREAPPKRTIKRCAEVLRGAALERTEPALNLYRKAFSGFSDEEIAILDGVILAPPR
jgi:hypothetical protein